MHTSLDVLNLARKACPRRRSLLLALTIVMVAVGARIELAAVDQPQPRPFAERDLNGTWVLSGLVKFAAPIPIHALILHGGAPHTLVAPGEKVGIWASQVGLMRFDGRGRVLYRGRIDDRYLSLGVERPVATRRDLDEALTEIVTGKAPHQATTQAVGCYIADFAR